MTAAPRSTFKGTDRFVVQHELGAGGMGVVYDTLDQERNSRVALKTLLHLDAEQLYLFKQEFRALSNIVHDNLVPLYELISDGDHWFFTMELIDGPREFLPYLRGELDEAGKAGSSSNHQTVNNGQNDTHPSTASNASIADTFVGSADDVEQTAIQDAAVVGRADANSELPTAEDASGDATGGTGTTADDDGLETGVYPGPRREDETVIFSSGSGNDTHSGESDDGVEPEPVSTPPVPRGTAKGIDFDRLRATMIQVAEGVQALHAHDKLHRDLKPANTLIRKDGSVVLLDFGLVVELNDSNTVVPNSAENSAPELPATDYQLMHTSSDARIAGTVAYMSPEQAMARSLTPATDWYAFGVMLFQAITGQLPIQGKALKVLTRKCEIDGPAPSAICADVPPDLDDLCQRLLKLDPWERPSAEEILSVLAGENSQHTASTDVNLTRGVPFVGRTTHLAALNDALDKVLNGNAVLQRVHGRSGAGKSALIDHFLTEHVARRGALVLKGRCYEQESVPYKAVDSLVDTITRYLLKQSAEELADVLPQDVGMLARIFPVLKRVPKIAEEAERSVSLTNLKEIRLAAFRALRDLLFRLAEKQPLVIYIDDLQWGDIDSAALLAELVQPPDAPSMLMLLAYRSEYTDTSECLQTLASLLEDSSHEQPLQVETLTNEETRELTETLIGRHREDLLPQAEWIVRESRGSALFVYELVRHLQSGADLSEVQGVSLDDVLWRRAQQLPQQALQLLEVVAVSGQPVPLRNAQEAMDERLPPQIPGRLRSEQFVRSSGPSLDDELEMFHDRIRESVVARLDDERKVRWHKGLAVSLERSGTADPDVLALHFENGQQPAIAFEYYVEAANHAVTVLAFGRAEELYQKALSIANSDIDKATVYEHLINFYTDMARFEEAYETGRTATAMFGIKLPRSFIPPLFLVNFLQSKLRLRGRKPEQILDLPTVTDERMLRALQLGNVCSKAAYQIRPELCVAMSTKLVNVSLVHGNTPDAAISYMVYGAIFQGGVMGIYQTGFDYGRLALALIDKYDNEAKRAEVSFVVGYFGTSWLRPVTEAEKLWQVARESGLATGDLFHTGCAIAGTLMSYLMRGENMDRVLAEAENDREILERAQLTEPLGCLKIVCQAIRALRGQTSSPTSLSSDSTDHPFDEDAFRIELDAFGSRHFAHFYFITKMQLHYMAGEFEAGLRYADESSAYLKDSPGMLHSADHVFYHGLLACAAAQNAPSRRSQLLKIARKAVKKFHRWSELCEHNFSHKYCHLKGQLAAAKGDLNAAAGHFEDAIQASRQFGYSNVEYMAARAAAELEERRGNKSQSEQHNRQAEIAAASWGLTDSSNTRLIDSEN